MVQANTSPTNLQNDSMAGFWKAIQCMELRGDGFNFMELIETDFQEAKNKPNSNW